MKYVLNIMILLLFTFGGCDKEEEPEESYQPLVFVSLTAEKMTLSAGETTKIRATATGTGLVYAWSATLGDILGSGHEVTYASSICHIGKNKIICKITDSKNKSESKTIEITVGE